jgi:hypothetical protein
MLREEIDLAALVRRRIKNLKPISPENFVKKHPQFNPEYEMESIERTVEVSREDVIRRTIKVKKGFLV